MNSIKRMFLIILCLGPAEIAVASAKVFSPLKIDTAVKLNNTGNAISGVEMLSSAVDTASGTTHYLLLQSLKFGDKRILRMTVRTTSSGVKSIGRGANVFFTLSDGTVIVLANMNNELAKPDPIANTNQITGNYQLADDDEIRLCSNKVLGLQLQYDGGVFRFILREEDAAILQRQVLAIK